MGLEVYAVSWAIMQYIDAEKTIVDILRINRLKNRFNTRDSGDNS